WAYSVRSLLYLEANCVIEAERDAARACQLDPHWAEPRLLRGRALARMRRYSEAKMAVHQALAIDPGIGGARELLGLIHAAQSDDEAEQKLVMNASASFVSRVTTPFGYTQKQRRGAAVTSLLIGVLAIVIQVAIVRRYGVVHTTNAALWLAVLVAVAFASKINRRPPS
ncbi:MAG: hypothetical protein OEY23_16460, partial [Acidimicrobiia bacterium]|nr:hypothetical protein [Acidimicrobiia bacterium]